MRYLILLIISFISVHTFAQETYIHADNAYDVMRLSTEVCDELHELWEQNDPKAIDVADRLILLRNKKVIHLVPPGAKTLLSYHFCDFKEILADVKEGYDYHYYIERQDIKRKPIRYPHHMRSNCYNINVLQKVTLEKDSIITILQESALQTDEKEFLILYLVSILERNEIIPEQMNRECDDFVAKYPDSEYASYVNQVLNLNYETRKFGIGFGLFFGYHFLGGNVSNYVKNPMPIGVNMDLAYKRFVLKSDLSISIERYLKKDFLYQDKYWTKDTLSYLISGNLNLGYILFDNLKYRLTPYLGIGKQVIPLSKEDISSIDYRPSFNIGVDMEWKFAYFKDKSQSYNAPFFNMKDNTYWSLFLRVGYSNLNCSDKFLNGSMFYLKIGIGGFTNSAKRVYK